MELQLRSTPTLGWMVLVLVIVSTGAVLAQAKKEPKGKPAKPRSGWIVQCSDGGEGLVCKAIQAITMRRTGQRLLTVSVQRNKDGKGAAALYHLPHGIFLPAGVDIIIDKAKPKKLVIQTCDRKGCYSGAQLTAAEVGQMSKAKILSIAFKNLAKKTITLNMPLGGFGQAYAKLK